MQISERSKTTQKIFFPDLLVGCTLHRLSQNLHEEGSACGVSAHFNKDGMIRHNRL
jgi:hypothetical protein